MQDLITPTNAYPRIAAEKYEAALTRVYNVHARFQKELGDIGQEISKQAQLSTLAIERCRQVTPCLGEISDSIKQITVVNNQAGKLVQDGREKLESSIGSIQATIEQLQQRNSEMQNILDISQEVSDSVNKIAEIAIENKVIAINASVTASKASDRVKGFKVIANEITRLSATMADRVTVVVEYAAQVGKRMQQIMQNMDASINSTRKALGSIDEAFNMLDNIVNSIGEASSANSAMLSENNLLVQKIHTIEAALAAIEKTIRDTGLRADGIQELMQHQDANLKLCMSVLPELQSVCDQILQQAGGTETVKHLTMAEMPVQTYDPIQTRMLREMHYMSFVGIRLLRYSSDKKLVPYLAETWILQQDGRTWEFVLKDGVRFHDGSPVSAHDVKFSLERLMNPVLQSPYANMFSIIEGADQFIEGKAGSVSGIRVINNLTVNITLKNTFNFFLGMLALTFSSIIKSDRSKFSKAISKDCLISAGPFRVLDSGNAEIDLLEANPDFVNGRPFIDRLEIRRNLPDLAQGLIDGHIDLGYNLPALSADVFKEAGFKGKTKYYTSRYCYGMLVNYKRSNIITRNAELRRALVMSINKDEMISTYLKGNAVRADSVLPPETFDTGGRVFIKHDIEKAAEIAEALRSREDFSQPLKLALRSYITLPRLPEMGQRIAENFARLGIQVEISIHPATSQIVDFIDDYDLIFLGFLSEIDLYSALEPFINPEGGDNYFGYNNPSILKMLEDSITIKDNAVRRQVFLKILEDLTLDVFMIPLFFQKVLCVSSMQVHSVFLSAEESFIPEAVYLSAQYSAESSAETAQSSKSDSEYSKTYSSVVNRLDEITGTIVASSNELINKGKDISRTIIEQKSGITAATELFDSFSASAGKVRQSRTEVVEQIRQTATQAGRSSQAAQLINNGLAELMHAINGTLLALNQVKKDISTMLKVARSISESNSFIGSVAINAAIISTKTDVRGGDLIKVSQSISEQALRNTEYTEASQHILDQMNKKVLDNIEVLGKLINNLELASVSINQSGTVLDKVGPLLNTGTEKSRVMESAASRLETYIADALQSVDKINQEGTQLALSAETLEFGLDMEQAVADILKDVSWINKDIRDFHLKTQ